MPAQSRFPHDQREPGRRQGRAGPKKAANLTTTVSKAAAFRAGTRAAGALQREVDSRKRRYNSHHEGHDDLGGQVSHFEPYFSTKPDGVGLGLSVARRTATALGAGIVVQTRLEHGTEFTVNFRAAERQGAETTSVVAEHA